jgi:hypothetical protein
MVSGAIDWNICPLVLGMTKGSTALLQYNLWSFPGPQSMETATIK